MSSDPLILGFDTSAAHCAAALLSGDRIVASAVDAMTRGQVEQLMPLLENVLKQGGASWQDLNTIGVGIGPGNFTGIRIAVSAARGLSLSLGIPAVGISLFDTTKELSNWAQVAVSAPREQVYFMDFDEMTGPCLATPDSIGTSAYSSEHDIPAHVACIARLAAKKGSDPCPPPAPLYIKPADAAPGRDLPPVILDDA